MSNLEDHSVKELPSVLQKQCGSLGEGWSTLADLAADRKWYAVKNRMRRGVIEEDEFRAKSSSSAKTALQLLEENADQGLRVEMAYRYVSDP
jgi:hypothetical protein